MKAFGATKRTYHDCRVYQAGSGKKVKFTVGIKNRKLGRKMKEGVSHENRQTKASA